jgi:hypothetical protein
MLDRPSPTTHGLVFSLAMRTSSSRTTIEQSLPRAMRCTSSFFDAAKTSRAAA